MRIEDVKPVEVVNSETGADVKLVEVVKRETGAFAGLRPPSTQSIVPIVEQMRERDCNLITVGEVEDGTIALPSVTCFRESSGEFLVQANKGTELKLNGAITKKIRIERDGKVSIAN